MKKGILFLFVCLMSPFVRAQNVENSLLEKLTEILVENTEETPDIEEMTDIWQYYLENRININTECSEQLRQLGFLSEFQIQKIADYKKGNNLLLSIYELSILDDFSRELLETLEPFLYFGKKDDLPVSKSKTKYELILKSQRALEEAKGYSEDAYAGSPDKYYMRIKGSGEMLNWGIAAEKDPGESFFTHSNKSGFDFYSGFANVGLHQGKYRFYIGDFLVRAGQGLNIWQGFSSGKSSDVSQVYKANQGIRSYSSSDENRFFRGMALSADFKNASFFVFHSEKNIDANIDEVDGQTVFTSFQTSGLHRTDSEIADKHSVKENVSGTVFSFQQNNFSLGFSGIYTFFNHSKVMEYQLYNLNLFEGREIANAAIDYKWSLNRLFLFGEMSTSTTGGFANLHGAMIKPADRFELSLLYRNIGRKYNSLYGQAFTESSSLNDENGLYVGVKFLPVAKVAISAYRDFFQYRWLKNKTAAPSVGNETFFHVSYIPNHTVKLYLRYFSEQKEVTTSENQLTVNSDSRLRKLRINADLVLTEKWSFKSRVELAVFKKDATETGILFLQDIKYKSDGLPFSCQLRLAWFNTETYNCRIYTFEDDLLYNFSAPALSGKGVRTYLNGKCRLSPKFDLWMKLSRTQYFDEESIGGGWETIIGDRKTEMKFELRYRF